MTTSFDAGELARWSRGEWTGCPSVSLTAVVHDTRHVQPGSLFVAIRGARFDGHDFIPAAISAGARAAMVSRDQVARWSNLGVPLLAVDDTALALRRLATGYRVKLGLTVVGVTGSTGKTTVKEMIARLLDEAMPTARTKGNWNNEIGLPLSILAIPPETRAGVLELGISHPGEMAPLCAIARPDWGVITNVGPVHLEFFESVEAIAREKGALFQALPAGGTAVVSCDEGQYEILRRLAPGRVITTSLRKDAAADYRLVRDDLHTGLCGVEDCREGGIHEFHLPVPGLHNRHNALLAIAVARGLGVSWDGIRSAFERYVAPPMRWERTEVGGLTLINDAYNANPVSMRAAIKTFAEMECGGRKWLALGDMLELGAGEEEEHRALGRMLTGGSWAGLVTVGRLGARIAEGALAAGMADGSVHVCADTTAAAAVLKENITRGDALLIKASRGKRMEEIASLLAGKMEKD